MEINPLVITSEGDLNCLDGKINVDGNALFRQPKLESMQDSSQEDEREARAAEWDLNYVALDGNIGCMVNGAGLAMGTMDIVQLYGESLQIFLMLAEQQVKSVSQRRSKLSCQIKKCRPCW